MSSKFFFLFLLLCNFGSAAVQVTMVPGQPVEAKWPDGRIATLVIDRKHPLLIPIEFEVSENTCTGRENMRCEFGASFLANLIGMTWSAHPDKAKIGKGLVYWAPDKKKTSLFDYSILTSQDRKQKPKITQGMSNDEVTCADYSWLPGGTTSPPELTKISRWDSEAMYTNPETGLMENRTLGVAMNLELQKTQKGNLELGKIKNFVGTSLSFFFADIWALIYKQSAGDFCQISLKANVAAAVPQVIGILSQPPKFATYIYGSDEYSNVAAPATISYFLKNPDKVEVE